jgi:hypothetical protein
MRSSMTRKLIFTALARPSALPPRLLHRGAIKLAVTPAQPTSSYTISHRFPASFSTAEKKER